MDYTTSTNDQQSGIAISDLHIYVTYVTDNTLSWTATGKYCKVAAGSTLSPNADPTLARGRPIMGRIKFNTAHTLDGTTLTDRLFADTTASAIHELIHIMGFDSSLYGTFLDSATNKAYATPISQTATGLNASRLTTKMITSPKVVAWAKAWFNCNSITGMLLENEGFDGDTPEWAASTDSHWDRTLMYDELMTRTAFSAQRGLSGLTYAFLMDMGWYTVDDTFNDTSPYGYHKGCDFFFQACNSTTSFDEFCDPTLSVKSCTTQNFGKAVCQTSTYSDKCGIWVSSLNCVDSKAQDDGSKTISQEAYGTTSFCVSSTLSTVALDPNLQSRCYPYVCHNNGTIVFTVGVNMIVCLSTDYGVNKTLAGLSGYLTCPDFEAFCEISRKTCPNWCSQNGFCTRGICNCRSGYSGESCNISSCTTSTTFYNPSNNTCMTICPSGTYGNAYAFTCMKCDSTCSECVREPTVCTSCVGGFKVKYGANCYDACPPQTYLSGSECFDCTAPCFNCTSNLISTCTSCQSSLYLSTPTTGTCETACSGIYPMYDKVNFKCVSSCTDNLVKTGTDTCELCPAGQYKNVSNLCNATCPTGYYPDDSRRFCGTCHTSCLTCAGVAATDCTGCLPTSTNKYLYLGQCVFNTSCPLGTYADGSSLTCTLCPAALNCSSCVNTTANGIVCIKCKYGWFMNSSGKCDLTCASNQYKNNGNNSCVNCNSACSSCTSGTNNSCTGCNSLYLLKNASGGYCLNSCPLVGYYGDNFQCISCYSSCRTCSGSQISSKQMGYRRLLVLRGRNVPVPGALLLRLPTAKLQRQRHFQLPPLQHQLHLLLRPSQQQLYGLSLNPLPGQHDLRDQLLRWTLAQCLERVHLELQNPRWAGPYHWRSAGLHLIINKPYHTSRFTRNLINIGLLWETEQSRTDLPKISWWCTRPEATSSPAWTSGCSKTS